MPIDDLIEGLVSKLGDVSPKWTEAFPPIPAGYRKLNRLISKHGYGNVKNALQFALDEKIQPMNPMAVLIGIIHGNEKVDDVPVQEGLL